MSLLPFIMIISLFRQEERQKPSMHSIAYSSEHSKRRCNSFSRFSPNYSSDYSSSSSKSARISRTWLTNSTNKVFSEHRNMLAAICVQGKSPIASTLTGHLMSLYKAKRSLSSFRMRLALSTVGLFGNLTPFSSESNVSRVYNPDTKRR